MRGNGIWSPLPVLRERVRVRVSLLIESLESRVLLSALPAPLTATDVGAPTGGSNNFDSNTGIITVVGAGHDLFDTSDAFHYVFEPLDGDGTITVQIDSDSANAARSLAGLDIRSSLSPSAANVFVAARDDGSVLVNSRGADGGAGVNNASQAGSFSQLLRLTRAGSDVEAFVSSNGGTTFQNVASTTINFPSSRVLVGLAVASLNAPTTLATATFEHLTIVPSTGPSAAIVTAPNVVGRQAAPYQFSVTYNSGVAIDAATLGAGVMVTAPDNSTPAITLISTGLIDDTTITATYQIPAPTQVGAYQISANGGQVSDVNGNPVGSGGLGSFNLIADATPPIGTLYSAPALTAKSSSPYQFTLTYNDNGLINAASIANTNLLVQLPDGSTQAPTLVSTGLTSASVEVVTYQIPTPSINGTFTIKTSSSPISDLSGNPEPAGTLGTFLVSIPNSISGKVKSATLGGVSGATVFADINGDQIHNAGEPSATTDTNGNYTLFGLADGSYNIVETAAGQQVLVPLSGIQRVTVANGQAQTAIDFINAPADNASEMANLTGLFHNKFAVSIRAGAPITANVRVINSGSTRARGFINITLLLITNGAAVTTESALKTVRVNLNLAKRKFIAVLINLKVPVHTAAGSYKVAAIVDSGNAVHETSELDNVFSSTPITIRAH